MEQLEFTATENEAGVRIDRCLSDKYEELSRSYLQKLLKEQGVTVNGKAVKANYKIQAGDLVQTTLPDLTEPDILPENIPLDILYEDDDVLVINKPKGMVVHPANGHTSGTLVNAIMYHCQGNLSGINGVMRPGIVHRIDKDTTGALLVCKNDTAHRDLAQQLKAHTIKRRYRAIVAGNLKEDEGTVDAPVGRHPIDRKKMAINYKNGKEAVTHYKVLERFGNATYIECRLETGRTHQIRAHLSYMGHPIFGDPKYGDAVLNKKLTSGYGLHMQLLHAWHLVFPELSGDFEGLSGKSIYAPAPKQFVSIAQKRGLGTWEHGIPEV